MKLINMFINYIHYSNGIFQEIESIKAFGHTRINSDSRSYATPEAMQFSNNYGLLEKCAMSNPHIF